MLNRIVIGELKDQPPLLIAHGLFGSGRNWGVIAKRLADTRQVICVDMRNHGESAWSDTHTYPELAADLAEVIEGHGGPMDVLGHSMGGKAAMALSILHPELVNRLIVADIAPVSYEHTQIHLIEAMNRVSLAEIEKRSDVEVMLRPYVDDPMVRSFLLQSLNVQEKIWRLNLAALSQEMPKILGFPDLAGEFSGPTMFLSGANSDYVKSEYRPKIISKFPRARFAKIPGAGHWLHAEKPREFEAVIRAYLDYRPAV